MIFLIFVKVEVLITEEADVINEFSILLELFRGVCFKRFPEGNSINSPQLALVEALNRSRSRSVI